ncbi:MAG: electron transfer flavoprotein subunit alpha/FixB family protein, partial [Gammaproteobacteria bacterium]|nr:electron transfer flavoprotein subunit alpha/FixB family protein [Gammaproteobacteria bacterium]
MTILVIAEHDNNELKAATLNTVAAAEKLGAEIALLVAGHNCSAVAEAGARVARINKVLVADSESYSHPLAESLAKLIVSLAAGYSHILAPATTSGKNF